MDEAGHSVAPAAKDACKWCLYGSVAAAYPNDVYTRVEVIDKLVDRIGGPFIANWNDEGKRTQAEVVKLLESIGQ
jgi:hypothetical protein